MRRMQLREAKAKLSEVVDAVLAGEPTTITRHGTPVAMVVPFPKGEEIYPPKPGRTLVEHLMAFPGGLDLELERDHTPPREIDL